jgi:AcrR family transcriptional regulator
MTSSDAAQVRGEKRRTRTRARILDAAEEMAGQADLSTIRIEDVAARAGVSPASVYTHFQTKDGLLAAVVDHLLEVGTEALEQAFDADLTPYDRFLAAGAAYIRLLLDHPALVRYLVTDRVAGDGFDAVVDRRIESLRQRFEDEIAAALASGAIQDAQPRGLSFFLMGAWLGVASLALRTDAMALDRDAIESAVIEAGLALAYGYQVPAAERTT